MLYGRRRSKGGSRQGGALSTAWERQQWTAPAVRSDRLLAQCRAQSDSAPTCMRRFTAPTVRTAYQYPAGHLVDVGGSGDAGWMGMRARVRAAFPCWALRTWAARVICRGLKQYGMILADVGSPWYLTGEATPAWEARLGPNHDQCE